MNNIVNIKMKELADNFCFESNQLFMTLNISICIIL